jgi:ATP-dependent Clp protease ATP-binding subunit ClpA
MIVHHDPNNQDLRRILELCDAGTPEGVLAEMDRQRPSQPPLSKWLEEALASASDDAAGRNEVVVRPENLFVGLHGRPGLTLAFLADAGVNVTSLRVALAERLDREQERQARPNLPLNAEAQRILDRAIARADERRHDTVGPMRLLEALIEDDAGFVPDLVIACGGDLSHLRRALAKA